MTSPWYREMCAKLAVPALIAEELDMDPEGSESMFFSEAMLREHERLYTREPVVKKRLDGYGVRVDLLLWDYVDPVPSGEQYVIGCDVSQGTGATPSVASIASKRTRTKIGELA